MADGRAYLVRHSSEQAEAQQVRFAELAAAAGVGQLVLLSQLAADEAAPARFLRGTLRWNAHPRARVRLHLPRPNLHFQGVLGFVRSIASEGRFFVPIGDAR